MTTLVSQSSSAATGVPRSRGRWFGRIARGVAVLAVVTASATVVGATSAHAADTFLMQSTIGGEVYKVYGVSKNVTSTGASGVLKICGSGVNPDGPSLTTCTNWTATYNFSQTKGKITTVNSAYFGDRRLMAGDGFYAFPRTATQPPYDPGALPGGSNLTEVRNLLNQDLGFRRFSLAGANYVQVWAPRVSGVVDGNPRGTTVNMTALANSGTADALRQRTGVINFMQAVREAEAALYSIGNISYSARHWVGLTSIGGAMLGTLGGSSAVYGLVMAAAPLFFFLPGYLDGGRNVANAVARATDQYELTFGVQIPFGGDQVR